ncbi:MAG TPA: response regulator, partial [Polyangiaceae bacterium]|nr:response regulator [Polyangiaceae bacterium]
MRSTDWSKTKLGPVELWPQSLKTMLGVVLGSRFPMLLWWGPELLHLYNDAYRPILRDKHPASLAAPAAEIWAEVWDVAGPLAQGVMAGGPATWIEDLQLFIANGPMLEETYFTFSYSPVPGDDGKVGGLLNTVQETTAKVHSERQIKMRHELSERASHAQAEDEAFRIALEVMAENELDMPFACFYSVDEDGHYAHLVGSTGLSGYGSAANAKQVSIAAGALAGQWPFADAYRKNEPFVVEDLRQRFGPSPKGRWNGVVERAIVVPLMRAGRNTPHAFLVAGISPHRQLDDRYRRFFSAIAEQTMNVLNNVRAYQAEKTRAEALAGVDRAKTAFFSNVSHEFRTPLTLMLGPLEDALASPSHALVEPSLQMVHRNALRLMKLVNTLLDFSRIEAGRAQAAYQATDLSAMTQFLASTFRSAIDRTGLGFEVNCQPTPEPVYVDHDMWEKIVLNLLSNALKFTFDGTISVFMRDRVKDIEFEVRDTGVGIPETEIPRLFERFHRVQGARSRTHEGSGIGLALVNDLVKLHGGSVRAESVVDKGTRFIITIPKGTAHLPADHIRKKRSGSWVAAVSTPFVLEALRWSAGDQDHALASPTAVPAPTILGTEAKARPADRAHVLVVDDNADLRDYMVNLLKHEYTVTTAVDGLAGLKAAREQKPNVILSDVMMPGMDGFALLKELRADPALTGIPVILLSARAGEEATIEGLQAGADDYLVKPFSARELLARVNTQVEVKRTHEALIQAKQEAELANRELESFSYSVAHDLRAPLRSIDGFSQALLEDYAPALDADGKRHLTFVREAAQHMALLIDDLLALSRVTLSELEPREVDLSALAQNAVTRLAQRSPERTVEIVIQ